MPFSLRNLYCAPFYAVRDNCWLILSSLVLLPPSACLAQATKAMPETQQLQIYPVDLAVSQTGTVFVADPKFHGVWKWNDNTLSKLFEGSPKFRTPMNAARTVAMDHDGSVLVGDSATREIYRFDANGRPQPITGGKIGIPYDMAVASDGTIYIADLELHKLMRIPAGSKQVEPVADVNPRGVCVDAQDRVWVISQNAAQLLVVDSDGQVEEVVSKRTFNFPQNVAVNASGDAFVTDNYEKAIWIVPQGGEPKIWFQGAPLENPVGIVLVDELPVVVDPRTRQVLKFDAKAQPTVWFEIDPAAIK